MFTNRSPGLLEGKVVVVIGGTSGLGLSAVRAFLAAGAKVASVGLAPEEAAPNLSEFKDSVRTSFADATHPETAAQAIAQAVRGFGKLDGIYHVAGGSGRRWGDGPLHEISDEAWRLTLELNLTSVFYTNRAAVRQFLAQGTGGSVLNLGSVLASSPSPSFFSTQAYATAKAGIVGLARSCAAMYASKGIRFNVIAPGLINTPMARRAVNDPRIRQFVESKQPLDGGRVGTPTDLDSAAVYFMSDASRFATGQVLAVDGGWSLTDGQMSGMS
jgi:NAD(P)-dependent dehydrogenase (short-subunit alcohol dehydrogenase family)